MRKVITLLALIVMCAVSASAKDIKEVRFTTEPPMHCNSCETKIKNALKFEKGVKDVVTNISDQCVTVTYDADKNTEEAFVKALNKVGYEVRPYAACQNGDGKKCAGDGKVCGKTKAAGTPAADCCKKEKKNECAETGSCASSKK